MSTPYDVGFYRDQQDGSQRSARQTMPLLLTIFAPKSVVDVGCGVGTWLAVLRELGVTDLLGLDGDYVDRSMLRIPVDQFIPADFRQAIPTDRRFDLSLCLEVAEHF